MDRINYQITIFGRVQGVGFRYAAQKQARFLGIKGIVKNQPDGSVYIEAEGNAKSLNEFIAWCRKGPGFGFVENVLIDHGPVQNYSKFTISY